MRITLLALCLVCPLQAYAVNPPQWSEFSKGDFIDTANVKTDGAISAAYVMTGSAAKKVTTLYEVNCKGDQIRVHSDTPRYVRVPVSGGGSVVQVDDGFRTVVPGSQNARIESAICGFVAQEEAKQAAQEKVTECQREKSDDYLRVFELREQLKEHEWMCLMGAAKGNPSTECDDAGIPRNVNVVQYLHDKGIYLECEDRPDHKQSEN